MVHTMVLHMSAAELAFVRERLLEMAAAQSLTTAEVVWATSEEAVQAALGEVAGQEPRPAGTQPR
jgi:hypothetical protein